jgi:hypothetical protein
MGGRYKCVDADLFDWRPGPLRRPRPTNAKPIEFATRAAGNVSAVADAVVRLFTCR